MTLWKVLVHIGGLQGHVVIAMNKMQMRDLLLNAPTIMAIKHKMVTILNNKSILKVPNITTIKHKIVIVLKNKSVLKVPTTMTNKHMIVLNNNNKSVNKLTIDTHLKVATTMTVTTMSAINVITMIIKSMKGVSSLKLDYAIIIKYILMTTVVISLLSNIANMTNKMLLDLT